MTVVWLTIGYTDASHKHSISSIDYIVIAIQLHFLCVQYHINFDVIFISRQEELKLNNLVTYFISCICCNCTQTHTHPHLCSLHCYLLLTDAKAFSSKVLAMKLEPYEEATSAVTRLQILSPGKKEDVPFGYSRLP